MEFLERQIIVRILEKSAAKSSEKKWKDRVILGNLEKKRSKKTGLFSVNGLGLTNKQKNCKKFMYVYSPMKIPMSKQNAEQKRRKVC